MIEQNCGIEDQKELMNLTDKHEGERNMEMTNIQKLYREIDIYKQAIQDAKDALASAEQELNDTLEAEFEQ